MDHDQLVGRVWRYPQEKEVIFYHLVALGTPDIRMIDLASKKAIMADTFSRHTGAS